MLYYYVILLKVDWMYSLLRKSPFSQQMKQEGYDQN